MILLLVVAASAPPGPLRLGELVREVAERAPHVRVQEEGVEGARAAVGLAGAFPDPTVSFMAEDVALRPDEPGAPMPMLTYRVLVPLDPIFGRRGLSRAAAAGQLGVQQALLRRTSLDVRARAVSLFWELWMNAEMSALVDQQLAVLRRMEASALARYAAGLMMAHHDVLRAQAEASRMEAERASLDDERQAITAMLNVLRGRPAEEEVGPPDPGEPGPIPELAAVLERVARSPEVEQAQAMREEAVARVGLARRMYLPMVMVGAGYQQFTGGMPDALTAELAFTVPVFFFERQASELAMARAMERRAHREVELMATMTAADVRMAWSRARAADRALDSLRSTALPRMRQALDSSVAAYAAGTGDFLSMLDVAMALLDLEGDRIRMAASRGTLL